MSTLEVFQTENRVELFLLPKPEVAALSFSKSFPWSYSHLLASSFFEAFQLLGNQGLFGSAQIRPLWLGPRRQASVFQLRSSKSFPYIYLWATGFVYRFPGVNHQLGVYHLGFLDFSHIDQYLYNSHWCYPRDSAPSDLVILSSWYWWPPKISWLLSSQTYELHIDHLT